MDGAATGLDVADIEYGYEVSADQSSYTLGVFLEDDGASPNPLERTSLGG